MDGEGDYQEPDYSMASLSVKEESQSSAEDDKLEKIKNIIRREFANELQVRENEIKVIDQKMSSARWLLHRLRYSVVNAFYQEQKLQLNADQVDDEEAAQRDPRAKAEVSSLLREGQRRLHPSVRKLLGKQTVGLEEIFRTRGPRNKSRKNYSAMLQPRNYTIPADRTRSLRPDEKAEPERAAEPGAGCSRPRKVPRPLRPKADRVLTLEEASRNWVKHKYRIIIGNTSKYAKPASQADRSTHKWLLYVRGPPAHPDLAPLVSAVTVHLDHSYAPHHVVHIDKPPYHLSRRGWGEFPARVELHFALPDLNRPAAVQHTIKLDRHFTGLQTLGAETLIDVWLYSTPEMVQYEYKEESEQTDAAEQALQTKTEPTDAAPETEEAANPPEAGTESQPEPETETLNWMDFFTTTSKELDVDDMLIKHVKKEPEKDVENLIESSVIPKEVTVNGNNVVTANGDQQNEALIKTEPKEWEENRAKGAETLPEQLVNQTASPKKRIMKYMDPETGKIYYLEMDRKLDLSKVQEIVINSKGGVKTAKLSPLKTNGLKNVRKTPKGGVSLLKPEVKSSLKSDTAKRESSRIKANVRNFQHDHCYLGCPVTGDGSNLTDIIAKITSDKDEEVKETSLYDCLCSGVRRLECMRAAVNFCIKKIPLVSGKAKEPDFVRHFPFVVESETKYWRLDFAKRRNIEWSRAKLINRILKENHPHSEKTWRTKQILVYSRLHGYHAIRPEAVQPQPRRTDPWSSWTDLETIRQQECDVRESYPTSDDVTTLTRFDEELLNASAHDTVQLSESEDDVDVLGCDSPSPVRVKKEVLPDDGRDASGLRVLPVESEEDRLRFLFIEKTCEDIGIELKNEDVGNGYSYSAVHAVMLSAVRSFAEELVRGSLAAKLAEERSPGAAPAVWTGSSTRRALVSLSHTYRAAASAPRLQLAAAGLGAAPRDTCPL